jgi:hypothetical protein
MFSFVAQDKLTNLGFKPELKKVESLAAWVLGRVPKLQVSYLRETTKKYEEFKVSIDA